MRFETLENEILKWKTFNYTIESPNFVIKIDLHLNQTCSLLFHGSNAIATFETKYYASQIEILPSLPCKKLSLF